MENLKKALERYCSYQERCPLEVRAKLKSLGATQAESEEIMAQLMAENYLNEARFALTFASGKFRIKGWGPVRIKYELQQRNIPDSLINKALGLIDRGEYLRKIHEKGHKLLEQMTAQTLMERKAVFFQHFYRKGFYKEDIAEVFEQLSAR